MKGLVFDLQRYSIHDGPGIRTVVFLKGCPLQCQWCCNPESQKMQPEVEFRFTLCQQCGRCISACPENAIHPEVSIQPVQKIDRNKCTVCAACVQACPHGALRIAGQWVESSEVIARCLQDADVYRRSGGGITLSGGEPLSQPDFSLELLQQLYDKNINTAIETTGVGRWETLEAMLPITDLFLFDIKHFDPQKHMLLTGISNLTILQNLEKLATSSSKIVIRFPVIPGMNDEQENVNSVITLARRYAIQEIHLMPFHQFGKDKYLRFGYSNQLASLPGAYEIPGYTEKLKNIQREFENAGVICSIGG